MTLTKVNQLDVEFSKGITNFQMHSARLTLYSSKPNKSLTHKGKGKSTPLEAWTGPEGSSRMRLPDFKTVGT